MQRPFAKPFGLAESLLGKFRGHAFAGGVDFHGALADFDQPAVIAEHIFHEADDKVRHGILPVMPRPTLRSSARVNEKNIKIAEAAARGVQISGIDPNEAFAASQRQMLLTLSEIERQANVGIGYAF